MNCRSRKAAYAPYAAAVFLVLTSVCYGQGFTVTAAPSSLTMFPGQQNVPLTISVAGKADAPVTVTLSGLPSGIVVSPLTLTAGISGTMTLSASLAAGQEGFPPSGPSMTTSWTAPVTVAAAAGSEQATTQISVTVSISNPSFAPAPSAINLPILTIDTNGVPIVDKTTDVPGTITITSADGKTSYLPNSSDTDNTATFHVHGNSSAAEPKLPYHVSLNTGVDLLSAMGLQCPYVTDSKGTPTCDKSKSYVLLTNYDDKTLIRTWSASILANAIPIGNGFLNEPADSPTPSGTSVLMPWAPHSLYVELYLNGVYEGSYQIIEEVKVDSHRVNINELSDIDTAASQITGGYLMDIDAHEDADYVFFTPQNLPVGLEDPDFSPEVPQQTAYISSYLDAAETALFSSNFTDPTQGWRAYFDETSAINFYIINDVMGNVDGGDFYNSVYLYKDQFNPYIYMGPVWDFDISSGNVNYAPILEAILPWVQTNAIWYEQWFKDPGFKADVVTQWNALKQHGVFTAWLAAIQRQALSMAQTQVNNFGRWPMQGMETWPNAEAAGSYGGEITYFTNWLNLRIAYLDSLFNSKAPTSVSLGTVSGPFLNGSPVTLTAKVGGGVNPTGTVSFLASGVLLGVSVLNGGTAGVTVSNLPVGTAENLQAVYGGDDNNALSFSDFQTVAVGSPLAPTVVSVGGTALSASRTDEAVSSSARTDSTASFTASVTGGSGTVPTGTVTFCVDLGPGRTVTLDGKGEASYSFGELTAGLHMIAVSYSGDTNYSASSSAPAVFTASPERINPPSR